MSYKQCPYCKHKFPDSYLSSHMEYEHSIELKKTLKRLKTGIIISMSFVVIAVGVVVGLLL